MTRFINQLLSTGYLLFAIISLMGIAQAATPIDFGETLSESIDSFIEIDNYTFSVNPNDVILIRINKVSGSFSPEIKLFAPNGTILENKYVSSFEINRTLFERRDQFVAVTLRYLAEHDTKLSNSPAFIAGC